MEQLPKSKVFWKNTIRRWADGDFFKNPQGLTLLFGGCGDYLAIRFADNYLITTVSVVIWELYLWGN